MPAAFPAIIPAGTSNAGYMAYNQAAAFVKKDKSRPVPVHLRNAPTKLMKELGYGHAYRYAHDEPNAYAAGETYLPEGMREPGWYKPVPRGLELKIGEKLTQLCFCHSAACRLFHPPGHPTAHAGPGSA